MPRLFAGIEIPGDIQAELARLAFPLPGVRWVEPGDFHLTLRFYGDIPHRQAGDLAGFLGAGGTPAFEMRIKGLGAPGGREPKVIWANVQAAPELDALVRACERAARSAGLPPDTAARPFRPHVTLGRTRHTPVEAVARFLERRASFRVRAFLVTRFVLFSARPGTGGGPYVVEETYPLAGRHDLEESASAGEPW